MAKLKVKNVGPIKDGFNSSDGFIDFRGVTVFIGNQGSGKSTIAKLYSTFTWLEKALVRGDFTDRYLMQYSRFKKHLAYQNLSNYINSNSFIEYHGDAYDMVYQNGQFNVIAKPGKSEYLFPKIMYVPAERNFVSSLERPDLIRRLPLPLYSFLNEYEDAKKQINEKIKLPIGNSSFEHRKHSNKSFIIGSDYELELIEASSGFQSLVPLILVTKHLVDTIKNNSSDTRKEISREEEEKIRRTVLKMFEGKSITEDVLSVVLKSISAKFKYNNFINIVEEPEQNLFPESQRNVLFELLKYKNEGIDNKLIITTHSPYIINFLSISIQAKYLKDKIQKLDDSEKFIQKLDKIIPENCEVSNNQVIVYQLLENGSISILPSDTGIPSDNNFLNQYLKIGNEQFDALLELEEEL